MNKITTLLLEALPSDIMLEELLNEFNDASEINNIDDIIKVLQNDKLIDWDAYKENYEDVKLSNIDPLYHFVNFGIFEGRKLCSKNKYVIQHNVNEKKFDLSVILVLRDNDIYILERILNNELPKNIELILIAMDAIDKIKLCIQKNMLDTPNIKIYEYNANDGIHIARKKCVQNSIGNVILFSNVFNINSQLLETGYKVIKKGFDTCLCINDKSDIVDGEIYKHSEIIKMIIADDIINDNNNFFVEGDICKIAFSNMNAYVIDEYTNIYEQLFIYDIARDIKIIKNPYIINNDNYLAKKYYVNDFRKLINDTLLALSDSEQKLILNGDSIYDKTLKYRVLDKIDNYLENIESSSYFKYIEHISSFLGEIEVIKMLMAIYYDNEHLLVRKLKFYDEVPESCYKTKLVIGIFCKSLSRGVVNNIILNLSQELSNSDVECVLCTENLNSCNYFKSSNLKICKLNESGNVKDQLLIRLNNIKQIIEAYGIDICIDIDIEKPKVIWEILLFKLLHRPVVGICNKDYLSHFSIKKDIKYNCSYTLNVLEKINSIVCMNNQNELFYRIENINSYSSIELYIPKFKKKWEKKADRNILILGMQGRGVSNTRDYLLILREVLKEYNTTQMYLVGGFESQEKKIKFENWIKYYKLCKNFNIIGWANNIEYWMDKCSLFLSTALVPDYDNIFDPIVYGMPCIIYNLPSMDLNKYQNVITVNDNRRDIAVELIKENFMGKSNIESVYNHGYTANNSFLDYMNTFERYSPINIINKSDLRSVIKNIEEYSGANFKEDWPK